MRTTKLYLSFITFAFMAVISLTLASCSGDDDEDDATEQNNNKTGMISINETLHYQDPLGYVYANDDLISCYTKLFEYGAVYLDDVFTLDLSFSHCAQGQEVNVKSIKLTSSTISYTNFEPKEYQLKTGKIVCTKKTSNDLELNFSNVEILVLGYIYVHEYGNVYYSVRETLSYQLDGTLKFMFK